jgi:hypothetical protein
MQQLHESVVCRPLNVGELTQHERSRAMGSLIF